MAILSVPIKDVIKSILKKIINKRLLVHIIQEPQFFMILKSIGVVVKKKLGTGMSS
jgi:hypothetical protein